MAHTPGPWEQHSEYPDRIVVNGSCVYEVRDMTTEDGQPCVMDVALMASAPELLAALQEIAEECEYRLRKGEDSGDRHTLKLCRAAISKAERKGE
jgi:hypothetical protein